MKINPDACDYSCRKESEEERGAGATKPREQGVNRNSHGNRLALLPVNIVHSSAKRAGHPNCSLLLLVGNGTLLHSTK